VGRTRAARLAIRVDVIAIASGVGLDGPEAFGVADEQEDLEGEPARPIASG
jgi:hypothetical protein